MKILVVCPCPWDGTSFYRGIGPFSHLARHNPTIHVTDGSNMTIGWQDVMQYDIIFIQRPSTIESLKMMEIAKRAKRPVWIDYDDEYLHIPETNPRYELFAEYGRRVTTQDCMKQADYITVSTDSIGKSIREVVGPNKPITVIPNAYDEDLFRLPTKRNQQKIVLYRGGDTHEKDINLHKDAIIKCFFDHPEYTWAFMGHIPLWLTENPLAPDDRIRLYPFEEIMTYFDRIMELRPEITIVPLEDNRFNHGKSNINFIESTLCGAVTVAPKFLPEFNKPGIIHYNNYDNLYEAFKFAVSCCNQEAHYEVSKQSIPCLEQANITRLEIAEELVKKPKFFTPFVTDLSQVAKFNDQEFYDYCREHGYSQEHEGYLKGHYGAAQWMIDTLSPNKVIEFGCGPGAMLEKFHLEQIHALGVEMNDHFIDYFKQRNPNTAHLIINGDITDGVEFPYKFDLAVSIEVFEHIDMPEEKWDEFLTKMAMNVKWFYFTSTPYKSTEKYDHQWGHCNVRRFEKWKELFARNGWEFHSNPCQVVAWDMLFKSILFDAPVLEIKD